MRLVSLFNFIDLPTAENFTKPKEEFFPFEECGAFQKLPDHVMSKIFQNLKAADKIAMSQTCKRFNRIFSERRTLKDIEILVDFDTNYLPDLSRNYPNVIIKNLTEPDSALRATALCNFFTSHGAAFENITFKNCTLTDVCLAVALKTSPNLISLDFKDALINKTSKEIDDYPQLTKLKRIEVSGRIAKALAKSLQEVRSLEMIVVKESDGDDRNTSFRAFKSLMKHQSHLKKLEVSDGRFFHNECEGFGFQLNKLVLFIDNLGYFEGKHMLSFLQRQKDLSDVIINIQTGEYSRDLNRSMTTIIGRKLLRKLKIVFYNQSGMNVTYRDCRIVNPSVTELFLNVRNFSHSYKRVMETTSNSFPNLTNLHIKFDYEWSDKTKTSAETFEPLNSLTKLESLTLAGFDSALCLNLKWPKLKELNLLEIATNSYQDWNTLFTNNPSIESIYISFGPSYAGMATSVMESAILTLPSVQNISVCNHEQPISEEVWENLAMLSHAHGNIKKMRICGKSF